jgi:hypothetical protein
MTDWYGAEAFGYPFGDEKEGRNSGFRYVRNYHIMILWTMENTRQRILVKMTKSGENPLNSSQGV